MKKTEIQSRIEKCESEIASLKADLAKCEDGIEQERCWHTVSTNNLEMRVLDYMGTPKTLAGIDTTWQRRAYMPECRQVTAEDISRASKELDELPGYLIPREEQAKLLHKLGFRMKVTP